MLIRAIALSLALLVGIGTIVPFMTETTEAGPKKKQVKKKKLKKYSKAWWRWYRKEQRRKRAVAARKRALRAKQILLARQRAQRAKNAAVARKNNPAPTRQKVAAKVKTDAVVLPSGKKAPSSFEKGAVTNSELQFRVNDDNGGQLGTAALTVVGPAMGEDSDSGRNKMVGGVSTSSLRRNVIDKMIKEEGWVVNDYHKEINGKKVYVVVGQSSVRGTVQSRLFYFTEVDGKIYSLATNSSNDAQERIAAESEKVIQSLQRGTRPTQAGLK